MTHALKFSSSRDLEFFEISYKVAEEEACPASLSTISHPCISVLIILRYNLGRVSFAVDTVLIWNTSVTLVWLEFVKNFRIT